MKIRSGGDLHQIYEGDEKEVHIVHMVPLSPTSGWHAVYLNGDYYEVGETNFEKIPLACWAAVEILSEGRQEVVGLIPSTMLYDEKLVPAMNRPNHVFLGYDWPGVPEDWEQIAFSWYEHLGNVVSQSGI